MQIVAETCIVGLLEDSNFFAIHAKHVIAMSKRPRSSLMDSWRELVRASTCIALGCLHFQFQFGLATESTVDVERRAHT